MPSLNILHTAQYYTPHVNGVQEVMKQISERLVKKGHRVTVATSTHPDRSVDTIVNGVRVVSFDISGNEVFGYRGDITNYRQFLRDSTFDVILNYAAQQWATDIVLPLLSVISGVKILIPCGFSGLSQANYADYFRDLPHFLNQYDHLVFHADNYRDVDFARSHGFTNLTIIPNGASQQEFATPDLTFRKRYDIPENVPLIITVGSHTGLKGHRLALRAFLLANIGRAVLAVIAKDEYDAPCYEECKRMERVISWGTLGYKRVLMLDLPRADVVSAFHSADMMLFPSAVEYSPIVVYEAMASHTPFLATRVGHIEEMIQWGAGGELLPTHYDEDGYGYTRVKTAAKVLTQLINNPAQRFDMAQRGYDAWKQHFTWEKIVNQYEQLYIKLVNE